MFAGTILVCLCVTRLIKSVDMNLLPKGSSFHPNWLQTYIIDEIKAVLVSVLELLSLQRLCASDMA